MTSSNMLPVQGTILTRYHPSFKRWPLIKLGFKFLWNYLRRNPINGADYIDLFRYAIVTFDGTPYTHAAVWTGDAVFEATTNGVGFNPIDPYRAPETHVFEYHGQNGAVLAQPKLPFSPVKNTMDDIIATNPIYSMHNVALTAAMITLRRWRGEEANTVQMDAVFDANPNLSARESGFFVRVFRHLRNYLIAELEKMLLENKDSANFMCSQLVVHVFNRQNDSNYHFQSPDYTTLIGDDFQPELTGEIEAQEFDEILTELDALEATHDMAQTDSHPLAARLLSNPILNDFYSPGDVTRSPSTAALGRFQ